MDIEMNDSGLKYCYIPNPPVFVLKTGGFGPSGETRLHFLSAMRKENRGVAAIETGGEQKSTGLLHWMV